MRKDILSVVFGGVSILLGFCPWVILQLVGAAVGIVGFIMARHARIEDYRRDMLCSIGQFMSGAGVFLCLLVPVISFISNIALLILG